MTVREQEAALLDLQREAAALTQRVFADVPAVTRDHGLRLATRRDDGVVIFSAVPERGAPERLVVLIHGLDEPGTIFAQLVAALLDEGHAVATFEYPNDGPIAGGADLFAESLRAARGAGVLSIDVVAHSMGGLVTRDVLTRAEYYKSDAAGDGSRPAIERVVFVGTPHTGSPWARLRSLSEIREQVERWRDRDDGDPASLIGFVSDGVGEAGRDLLPGSEFLNDLNSRPSPANVRMTCIVGDLGQGTWFDANWLDSPLVAQVLGEADARGIADGVRGFKNDIGDGVVSTASARLAGVEDCVVFNATHRGLIGTLGIEQSVRGAVGLGGHDEPPGIAIVIDRLRR